MTLLQSRVNNVDVVFQCIALKMQINCWNFVPLETGLWILIYCYFSAFKQKSKQSLIVPLAISVPPMMMMMWLIIAWHSEWKIRGIEVTDPRVSLMCAPVQPESMNTCTYSLYEIDSI